MSVEVSNKTNFPLLPLRDVVVYPQIVQPLFVGRAKSIKALEEAMSSDKQVLLVAQKNASDDDPVSDQLFEIGTIATILQLIRLPDGTVKVLVEGLERAKILKIEKEADLLKAEASLLVSEGISQQESSVLVRSLLNSISMCS